MVDETIGTHTRALTHAHNITIFGVFSKIRNCFLANLSLWVEMSYREKAKPRYSPHGIRVGMKMRPV